MSESVESDPQNAPEWCKPGEKVAVVEMYGKWASTTVIKSVGKRYVVCDRGTRYDLRNRLERRSPGSYGTTYQLRPLSDEKAQANFREIRRKNAAYKASDLIERWRQSGEASELDGALSLLNPYSEVSS